MNSAIGARSEDGLEGLSPNLAVSSVGTEDSPGAAGVGLRRQHNWSRDGLHTEELGK